MRFPCPHSPRLVRTFSWARRSYDGADCSVAPPPKLRAEFERKTVAAIGGAIVGLSFAIGLALKVLADRRRRAQLLRYIQESDSQTPFVSSEFSKAMSN